MKRQIRVKSVKIEETDCNITYVLFENEILSKEETASAFGIFACQTRGYEILSVCVIPDLTDSIITAEKIFDAVTRNEVFPYCLAETIEEMYDEYC